MTTVDKVRVYASDVRVFSKGELVNRLGEEAGRAVQGMVTRGELANPAVGVYTAPGVLADDMRVLAKIEATGAKPISRKTIEARAIRIEEQAARRISKEARREKTIDLVRAYFRRQDVVLVSELRRKIGPNAGSALDALVKEGFLRRIENGLYARPTVDPLGPVMKDYIARNSIELATIKRELDEARRILPKDVEFEHSDIAYNLYVPEGPDGEGQRYRSRQYVNIPGYPAIYATSGPGGVPSWNGAKDTGIGKHAAEHLARMVFEPMPESYSALVRLIKDRRAPTHVRRRSGSYDVDDGWRQAPHDDHTPQNDHERVDAEHNRDRNDVRPIRDQGSQHPRNGGYASADTDRLNPARLSTPLPETVTLEIDDREFDWLVTRLTGVHNLHVMRTRLPIGDFRARHGDRELLFERKTSADLAASLQDGRLTTQVRALSEHGSPACFIVEGGMFGSRALPLAKFAAMQTRLTFGVRMPIIETIDRAHTAYSLVTAIRDHFFGVGDKFDLEPVRLKSAGPIEIAKVMLETIPGISPTRSTALLKKFGSLSGVCRATVERIAEIDGIGRKTAERLHEVLRAGA